MIRFIVTLAIFGAIAVAGLLYFDLIELTPEGRTSAEEAEQVIRDAAGEAGDALQNATDGN